MACPACGCETTYCYDNDDGAPAGDLERCMACNVVFSVEDEAPDGWCPICGGQDGEHKPGCAPMPGDIV